MVVSCKTKIDQILLIFLQLLYDIVTVHVEIWQYK